MVDNNEKTVAWAECVFEDLLDYIQPTNYIVDSTEYNNSYKIPVLTAGKSFIKGYTNENHGIFEEHPVIIFDDFTTASKYVNFSFKVKSSAMKILKPCSELVNLKYLYYYMQANPIRSDTHKRYWISVYAKKTILLPPLNEQTRIVAKIEELFSELDKGIENLTTAREQLIIYRQAVLKHAFEGKLTERNSCREEALPKYNFKPIPQNEFEKLPPIPSEWKYVYLSDLGDLGRGKSKHRPRNDPQLFVGKYPFIQTGEVKAANRIIKKWNTTYSEIGLKQSKLWPKGTLCITIAANIAETAFLGFDGCFPDSVVGFTPNDNLIIPEYIELFIKSVKARIEAYAPATAQKNINLTTLENLVIPLCSLEEQREIINKFDEILTTIHASSEDIETQLKKCEALRHSILKQAFSGKLVEQDPNDEPASILLERIKAEKQSFNQKRIHKCL